MSGLLIDLTLCPIPIINLPFYLILFTNSAKVMTEKDGKVKRFGFVGFVSYLSQQLRSDTRNNIDVFSTTTIVG